MRVIAGRLRGRVVLAPPGYTTRPTGARAKEALFSILGDLNGLRVLDLFSGSGALGIEALSRGAERAVFVEAGRPALGVLRENLTKLGLDGVATTLPLRVEQARKPLERHAPFDLVLCDPPWKDADSARRALDELANAGLFAAEARVVLEHAANAPPSEPADESRLELYDQRRWGDTAISFFRVEAGRAGDLDKPET